MKIAMFLPTRQRAEKVKKLLKSLKKISPKVDVLIKLDNDDPELELYLKFIKRYNHIITPRKACLASNQELYDSFKINNYDAYMFGSDDLVFLKGWDKLFEKAVRKYEKQLGHRILILYGDDMMQGKELPTHPFETKEFIEAIEGKMYIPFYMHHYAWDLWLKEIGLGTNILFYCPEIKIEHLHYLNKKSKFDETYRYNTENFDSATQDSFAYQRLIFEQKDKYIKLIKKAINESKRKTRLPR